MCRWLVYSGSPILLDTMIYRPPHSLIEQSMHARLGVETTNGDGFGVGWYAGSKTEPALFRGLGPAWSNRNLRELSGHIVSPLFFAHVRASTGTAVQETNCHPFRHGNWLWMHNGVIEEFARLRRALAVEVAPALFADIEGSTDSELMFFLALTFGLTDDPPSAVARMVGLVEQIGREHGVPAPVQMTVATSDGTRMWIFRYSSEHRSRTLFYSTEISTLRKMYPEIEPFRRASPETKLVVSEPLGDLAGAWNEVPESSYGVIQPGEDEIHPFQPQPPGSGSS
ncbi:class II glutamine amidotransferase [Longimycelium tulufanense]|uniref:Class II glutamine amidotransferase n=1 Tax=Longimycelium tulufanense TaxID=907463 RepID=A0A8J3CDH4_9PSEU|nr:class II glutamine amidotransferase [Longimycelium tulufanense]GGM63378.1 class II glutamine amidotransferase [Longimycelium tulufanense]